MFNSTKNTNLYYISQNQSQKEVLLNESLLKIDSLLNTGAVSRNLTTPPSEPAEGDLYIIPASATGAWEGHENKFTYYHASKGWVMMVPNEGMTLWVNNEDALYTFNGTTWTASGGSEEIAKLGVNSTADATNKLVVKSEAVLFDHDGGNSRVKANKATAADTSSHLFQTNYSGRAEFGLIGNNNFKLKLSSNGTVWEDIIEAKSTELDIKKRVDAEAGLSFDGGANTLSSYAEGTWLPLVTGSSAPGTNTYTSQLGNYVKIGNLVILDFFLIVTSLNSTGQLRISGLPFAPVSSTRFSYSIRYGGVTGAGPIMVNNSSSNLFLSIMYATSTGQSTLLDTNVSGNLDLRGTIMYRVL